VYLLPGKDFLIFREHFFLSSVTSFLISKNNCTGSPLVGESLAPWLWADGITIGRRFPDFPNESTQLLLRNHFVFRQYRDLFCNILLTPEHFRPAVLINRFFASSSIAPAKFYSAPQINGKLFWIKAEYLPCGHAAGKAPGLHCTQAGNIIDLHGHQFPRSDVSCLLQHTRRTRIEPANDVKIHRETYITGLGTVPIRCLPCVTARRYSLLFRKFAVDFAERYKLRRCNWIEDAKNL